MGVDEDTRWRARGQRVSPYRHQGWIGESTQHFSHSCRTWHPDLAASRSDVASGPTLSDLASGLAGSHCRMWDVRLWPNLIVDVASGLSRLSLSDVASGFSRISL